jgi:2-enoate reductase
MYQEKGLYLPYAQQLKEAIPDLPIIVAGRLDDPDLALRATREIGAEMVSLGRPVLADADIANKIGQGRLESIRPCISCQEGCLGRIEEYSTLGCAVNPEACREADLKLLAVPPHRRRKVMIIGGGVAGMEAARVLAERGHTPVLFEKADHLGGVVVAGGQPSFKDDDLDLVAWYEHELAQLEVEIHLGAEVTARTIDECGADELIVATGSTPRHLPIDFGPIPVVEATDALLDQEAVGQKVAIVGGGTTGCELALSLRERGREVTVVELEEGLLAKNGPLCAANRDMLRTLVGFRGTRVLTGSSVISGSAEGLEVRTPSGTEKVAADTVITATGYASYRQLWDAIDGSPVPKHLLGDARRVSNIMYAIWDAYEVASKI